MLSRPSAISDAMRQAPGVQPGSVQPGGVQPGGDATAAAMLSQLEGLHRTFEECLELIRGATVRDTPDESRLAEVRLRFGQARISRHFLIERIYAYLSDRATSEIAAQLASARKDNQTALVIGAEIVGKWTLREIAQHWDEYRQIMRVVQVQWRDILRNEKAMIYPLLEQRASGAERG